MAKMAVQKTTMTHKQPRNRTAVRRRVVSNGKRYDLKKLAARRTLVVRR